MGEPLDLLGEPAGVDPLDRLGDSCVQRPAPIDDHTSVSDIVRERVPKVYSRSGKSRVS